MRSIKKSTTKYNPNENIFLVSSNSQNKPDSLSENLKLLESNLTFREYQWTIALVNIYMKKIGICKEKKSIDI